MCKKCYSHWYDSRTPSEKNEMKQKKLAIRERRVQERREHELAKQRAELQWHTRVVQAVEGLQKLPPDQKKLSDTFTGPRIYKMSEATTESERCVLRRAEKVLRGEASSCAVPGCNDYRTSELGMCAKHTYQAKRRGASTPEMALEAVAKIAAERLAKSQRVCAEPGCDEPVKVKLWCLPHYRQNRYRTNYDEISKRRAEIRANWTPEQHERENQYRRYYRKVSASYAGYERGYREAHKEKKLEQTKNWLNDNPQMNSEYHRRKRANKAASPRHHSAKDRLHTFNLQRGKCFWCGCDAPWDSGQIDHVIPISLGGHDGVSNIVWTCASCNASKGQKLPSEWRYRDRLRH